MLVYQNVMDGRANMGCAHKQAYMEAICHEAAILHHSNGDFCAFGLIVHVCVHVDLQWRQTC